MDESTLLALRAALLASPSNTQLVRVVLEEYLRRDDVAQALPLLDLASLWGPEERSLGAKLAAKAGVTDKAHELDPAQFPAATPERPRLLLLRNGATESEAEAAPPTREQVRFADVGGLDDLKQRIHRRILLPLTQPSLFERFKRKAGGGVLLYGPPGCGKTLIARATAGECARPFFNVQISDVLDKYVGESERKLHELFENARRHAPSVMFIDEVEALGGRRSTRDHSATSNLVSQFLAELDGYGNNNAGVLVLGATNVPWAVDPAFRRPGRFDRTLFVPPPDRAAREAILRIHLAGRPLGPDVDPSALAQRSAGFSGADLQHLVETAIDYAIDASIANNQDQTLGKAQLEAALQEVKPSTREWLTTARNYARYSNEGGTYDEVLDFLSKNAKP